MRPNPLRERWSRGEPASCLWIDIGWPVSVEGLVKLPYDSFTLDLQHSLIDRGTAVNVLQALSLGTGVPLVRVTQNDPAEIGFVLDAGAYGVICPQIETAEECERFVAACRYAPRGTRSWGPVRGLMYGGADYFQRYEQEIIKVALLDQDVIAEEIQIDEAALRAQYETEQAAFEGSAEKRASHILFEVSADLSDQQALALATAARERLDAGEDFAVLAMELSSDTASAEEGGDIGYSAGDAFPPEIETVLATLVVNEVSAPVVTEFGVHLVKLTEDAENVFQSFEEVAERIERDMKRAQVELIYAERLADMSNLAFETGDLLELSQELNLAILQSSEITRNGGPGIFSNPQVIAAVFSDEVLQDGNNSDVIELNPAQAAVIRVQEFNAASILPLAEVEPEIAVILRTEMERAAVQSLGDEILTALESGADIQPLLASNELEWIVADGARRNAADVNQEILGRVFALPIPESDPVRSSLTLDNGTFVLMELTQVIPGTIESLSEAEKSTLTESMLVDLGNSDFSAFLTNLRNNADIQTRVIQEEL